MHCWHLYMEGKLITGDASHHVRASQCLIFVSVVKYSFVSWLSWLVPWLWVRSSQPCTSTCLKSNTSKDKNQMRIRFHVSPTPPLQRTTYTCTPGDPANLWRTQSEWDVCSIRVRLNTLLLNYKSFLSDSHKLSAQLSTSDVLMHLTHTVLSINF